MKKLRILLWIMAAMAVTYFFIQKNISNESYQTTHNNSAAKNQKVEIGADFDLTDHKGNRATHDDFKDFYKLVFFGFTFCPDICPATLSNISNAFDMMEKEDPKSTEKIRAIFITVDPERDDVNLMGEYMKNFHPKIIGLTGEKDAIRKVADGYKVYYALHKKDKNDTGYMVDHSGFIYLMSPEGKYLKHFTHETKPEEMAKKLNEHLN